MRMKLCITILLLSNDVIKMPVGSLFLLFVNAPSMNIVFRLVGMRDALANHSRFNIPPSNGAGACKNWHAYEYVFFLKLLIVVLLIMMNF